MESIGNNVSQVELRQPWNFNVPHRHIYYPTALSRSTIVDTSDPDITLPNLEHLYQTAEGLRAEGCERWMVLTGKLKYTTHQHF